jgi:hypothetical protein
VTTRELADRLGVSLSTVSRRITPRMKPDERRPATGSKPALFLLSAAEAVAASLSENSRAVTAGESETDFELRFTRVERDELRQQLTVAEATIRYQADLELERRKVQQLEGKTAELTLANEKLKSDNHTLRQELAMYYTGRAALLAESD